MKNSTKEIINEINTYRDESKAAFLPRFFKTGKGSTVKGINLSGSLFRICVLLPKNISMRTSTRSGNYSPPVPRVSPDGTSSLDLSLRQTKDHTSRETCVNFYVSQVDAINNWDLVDLSCYKILGHWLFDKDKQLLYDWAKENHLWKQRIAIISCMHFVKQGEFKDALAIADLLQHHPHDLIHKAVGWILREIGKRG